MKLGGKNSETIGEELQGREGGWSFTKTFRYKFLNKNVQTKSDSQAWSIVSFL